MPIIEQLEEEIIRLEDKLKIITSGWSEGEVFLAREAVQEDKSINDIDDKILLQVEQESLLESLRSESKGNDAMAYNGI